MNSFVAMFIVRIATLNCALYYLHSVTSNLIRMIVNNITIINSGNIRVLIEEKNHTHTCNGPIKNKTNILNI